ncbi:sulfhydryloxidase [Erinnyis ello granulovirus]|uniref:Sulfhydryloxidase n=1 Tax=Erinnyis ello granulovirus TaxID=307444 RepID=A0A097DAQ7_9BBAC|nr:sulfhydryloxidase [Erinnyis ello granulovirus]AIS92085.1 sulfhydryloxidase [Erinnyis ello granulovirus]ARX71425.1 p33 [Erinnyis ello granulovirus]ARX71555.1 p33 [Erinnyis ello granulovirus]ARX71685.1 p33 [Erinnyis ello granulovirus]ARX71815.1 p33 [Erinnyis ello granulovirus]
MLVETQTVTRYKQSFLLFVYRLLDMTRVAPSPELKQVIQNEVVYLFELACLLVYNKGDEQKSLSVKMLVEWSGGLGSDIDIAVFNDMYTQQLTQYNLQELVPKSFVFTFAVIWDSIHLMCLLADDVIANRHLYDTDTTMQCIRNLKWILYNVFIVLFCPVCAKHYLTINTFPYEVERVEVALYREEMGEPLQLVDEMLQSQIHKNVLYKHHLVYNSMVFHNHVNNYRPIQHKRDELNNFQRMEWVLYKTLLGIT